MRRLTFSFKTKEAFAVIGKEGNTHDGEGFIKELWKNVNQDFSQIAPYVLKDDQEKPLGIWGIMTDFSRSFYPWENNFTQGIYIAGAECAFETPQVQGFSMIHVPKFRYLCVENNAPDVFLKSLSYLKEQDIDLVGAVQDYTDPKSGQNYMYFPIERF